MTTHANVSRPVDTPSGRGAPQVAMFAGHELVQYAAIEEALRIDLESVDRCSSLCIEKLFRWRDRWQRDA